jgi:hypothetical protein
MIGIADTGQAEIDLAAGTLACPGCAGPLQPWGHARARTVRDHGTDLDTLLIGLYVLVDDHVIPAGGRGPGRLKRLSDAELVCLPSLAADVPR